MSVKQKGKRSKLRKWLAVSMIIVSSFLLVSLMIYAFTDFVPKDSSPVQMKVLVIAIMAFLPFNMLISAVFMLKCQKILKKILLTCLAFVMTVIIMFLVTVFTIKSDVSDLPQSFGVRSTHLSNQSVNKHKEREKSSENGRWYSTESEALNHFKKIKGKTNEDFFYIKGLRGTVHYFYTSGKSKTFTVYTLEVKDGKYFKPAVEEYFMKDYLDDYYLYDCDDAACDSISEEYIFKYTPGAGVSAMAEQDLYFGMWHNKKEVKSLTILGKRPDEIIPVRSGKRVYYFWTMENPEITKSLEDFNFSKFTYRKLAKHLQIKYTKAKKAD